jgi:hypothetical protein
MKISSERSDCNDKTVASFNFIKREGLEFIVLNISRIAYKHIFKINNCTGRGDFK